MTPNGIYLVDQFGRPALYQGSQDKAGLRPYRPHNDKDVKDILNHSRWRNMLSDSRWIATSFSDVAGAIRQKTDYVSKGTWRPHFTGADKAWGEAAEPILRDALKIMDPRGWPYTFEKNMRLGCRALDIEGDFILIKGQYPSKYPFLQYMPAHRIGQRHPSHQIVKGGRYDGAPIRNGLVYNSAGRVIAIHVLGRTLTDDHFIAANDVIWGIDPVWIDQGRGIPTIANAILDLYDIKTSRENEKIAGTINSSIALVESNATGTAPDGLSGNGASNSDGMRVEDVAPGVKHYVKNGGSLQAFTANRPSDQWQRFDDVIMRGAMLGLGWRVEMLDLSKLTGAAVRGFADNINTTIFERWEVMAEIGRRACAYVAQKLIEAGALTDHDEFYAWGFQRPPKFTVDVGRERAADLEDVRAGRKSMVRLIRDQGEDPEDVLREQARYEQMKLQIARENDLDPAQLGTLAKPGDQASGSPAAGEPVNPENDSRT